MTMGNRANRASVAGLDACAGVEAANDPLCSMRFSVALQEYLTANYERLLRRLMRHLGCADMARECLHDTWLRLAETEVRAAVLNPEAYLYRAACNAAMDGLRGGRPWQTVADFADLDHFADQSPGPEQVAAARSDLEALDRALDQLPQRHRAVLIALRISEMTREEVANRFKLSLRRVDTILRQALEQAGAPPPLLDLRRQTPVCSTAPSAASSLLPVRLRKPNTAPAESTVMTVMM